MENKEEKKSLTRAEKTEATKLIVREILQMKPTKHNELIEEVAKIYEKRHGEEGETANDVKGRVGSVLDIMKKNSDVMYDGGMYALKARMAMPRSAKTAEVAEEKTVKKAPKTRAKKTTAQKEEEAVAPTPVIEEKKEEPKAEKAAPKKRTRAKKVEEPIKEAPVASAPVEEKPVEKAPVAPVAVEAKEAKAEEKPTPKKRGRKPKAEKAAKAEEALPAVEEKKEEAPKAAPVEGKPVEEKSAPVAPVAEKPVSSAPVEEKKEEKALVVQPKAEVATKAVMDMSFLFGDKAAKTAPKKEERKEAPKAALTPAPKAETPVPPVAPTAQKPAPVVQKAEAKAELTPKKEEKKPQQAAPKQEKTRATRGRSAAKTPVPMTADEKLCESFLKKMRSLGGDYFEYYSTYLLERYSIKNGRRLEGLRISGGDHDGGIDGEIELTDALGFKETIYIQSKNWDPEKGKEDKWVVGETLLQQFIGACACRQAKDGKLHARGIFITTSRFTPEAKRILEDMADKIVGYDGNDLFEAAKECQFGLVKKNGEWALDEKLLSGPKAFFQMW